MSPELQQYLALEKRMLELDAIHVEAADALRDVMDRVWYRLSPDDRRHLDQRQAPPLVRVLEEVRLPITSSLFREPPGAARFVPTEPLRVSLEAA